ncbi:MAG: hypothetical protein FD175_1732 [Beijerinckiaceae bacterium]|nr:MAG: hypothetical protein FD175_1732 [Beijerinckiaceae bacterium]
MTSHHHALRALALIVTLGVAMPFGLGVAAAQSVAPQVPGGQQAPAAPASAAAGETKIVKSEVERKGRTGVDTFLATYLTLSKECKVGVNPRVEVTTQPKNGKINFRPNAINLRAVPGAPRTNCIGTSPSGLGVFYRAERRFKGEDTFVYRVIYPTGDIREVSAKVVIQ